MATTALGSKTRSPLDLALGLTLLDLLLQPVGDWRLRFPILALAAAGMLFPDLLRRVELWTGLTALVSLRVALDWPLPDNHAYLLSYWCLAVAISRVDSDPDRGLAISARWLIVGVFGFATFWKLVLSPDFAQSTFFHATLLQDPRFEDFTRLLGGLTYEQIDAARNALDRHVDGHSLPALAATTPSARFALLARGLTLWTLAIEFSISLAFAWPSGRGPSRLRDVMLILFCTTTYAVAPVPGFGWLLIAMGLAQCTTSRPTTRVAYLATFAWILFCREVNWIGFLADLLETP